MKASLNAFIVLAAAALATVAATDSTDCNLECKNDTPCVEGAADFSDHPTLTNGDTFSFHQETERDGMHCSCPHGWTGLLCDRKYESCDGTHTCYHGGRCIPGLQDVFGNEQLFCDCSSTEDDMGNSYVGKFCEHQSVTTCPNSDNFCVNEGTCNLAFPNEGEPCNCPPEYEGPHCEFKTDSVPDCTLDCKNGADCVLGIKDRNQAHDLSHLFDTQNAQADEQYMRCECPEGYTGELCDIRSVPCGTHECLNGSSCLEKVVDGETRHHCDCTTVTNSDFFYAGRFCQYQSTSVCPSSEGDKGDLFCVNGGTCKANIHEGCECPAGYYGHSCEFKELEPNDDAGDSQNNEDTTIPVVTTCEITCENGGVCRKGKKDIDAYGGVTNGVAHLSQTHDDNFEHCVCPTGFIGLHCEHEIAVCDVGEHVCLHGSKCVTNGNEAECDCDDAATPTEKYIGSSCQHQVTEVCVIGGDSISNPNSFCVNGGTCTGMVSSASDAHQGCDCPDGYEGEHCEFQSDNMPDCGLDCKNGGECILSMTSPNQEHDLEHLFDRLSEFQHCECPEGYGGALCDVPRVQCGEHHCFNGGSCLTKEVDGETRHHCDCTTATMDDFHYAGRFCQYQSNAVCTSKESENGELFCVNGGTCQSSVHEGCACPLGFYGHSCEFKRDTDSDLEDDTNDEVTPSFDTTCDLTCENDGVCRKGKKDLGAIAGVSQGIPHLDQTHNEDFEHCACPEGFIGLRCEHEIAVCGVGEHVCLHGSKCVTNGDEAACDCDDASTSFSDKFVGSSCQHQVNAVCSTGADDISNPDSFCINGGECKVESTAAGTTRVCTCPPDYEGPHCEFEAGMVPDCSLDCKNGGECILGITSFDQEHDLVHLFDNTDEFQRCECPPGYGGKLCETPRIECGEHHCFNGGSCLTRDINGETKHHCDCSTAAMGDYLFAGRFCQYQSSSICTPKESENGELFCVNGGSCKSESHEGCTCPDGYYGHSCEFKTAPAGDTSDSGSDNNGSTSFPEVTTCSLTCENGGVCRNGKKDLGLIDEVSQGVAELNPTHDENFEHCACADGFVGLRCEHEIKVCPRGEHVCLHGSQCVNNGQVDACDCAGASTSFSNAFAGSSCQHQATEMCTTGDTGIAQPRSFCVNNGTCKGKVSAAEAHPGCNCPDGFTGPHCEVSTQASVPNPPIPPQNVPGSEMLNTPEPPAPSGGRSSGTLALLGISITALLASAFVAVCAFVRGRNDIRMDDVAMATSPMMSMPRNSETQRLASNPVITVEDREKVNLAVGESEVYLGPPRDEDGNALHNVDII